MWYTVDELVGVAVLLDLIVDSECEFKVVWVSNFFFCNYIAYGSKSIKSF